MALRDKIEFGSNIDQVIADIQTKIDAMSKKLPHATSDMGGTTKAAYQYVQKEYGKAYEFLGQQPQVSEEQRKAFEQAGSGLTQVGLDIGKKYKDLLLTPLDRFGKEVDDGGKKMKVTMRDFVGGIASGTIGITNIMEGLKRGSITQVAAGAIAGLQGLSSVPGIGGMLNKDVGQLFAGGMGKGLLGMLGLGVGALGIGALGVGAYGIQQIQENYTKGSAAELATFRAEGALGPGYRESMMGKRGVDQWQWQKAAEYGVRPEEVAGGMQAFMFAGGRGSQARGVTEEALKAQDQFGTGADVFARAVGSMERWVPRGDFSKAISQGYMDAQKVGAGGLFRSGEWLAAQGQIVETMSRMGGVGMGGTAMRDMSSKILQTMTKYGFAGQAGSQVVGGMMSALPGMLQDPMKASFMYGTFGLTPMQMMRPGSAGTVDQILSTIQSGRFRAMAGSQFMAAAMGKELFGQPGAELFARAYEGKPITSAEKKQLEGLDEGQHRLNEAQFWQVSKELNKTQIEKMSAALQNGSVMMLALNEIDKWTSLTAMSTIGMLTGEKDKYKKQIEEREKLEALMKKGGVESTTMNTGPLAGQTLVVNTYVGNDKVSQKVIKDINKRSAHTHPMGKSGG